MGMEVGVATELVAGQGGRKKERGGGVTRPTEILRRRTAKKKGRIACVCVCACAIPVQ